MAYLTLTRSTDLPHPKLVEAVPPPRVLPPNVGGRPGQDHEPAAVEPPGGHTTGDQKHRSLPHTTRVYVTQYPLEHRYTTSVLSQEPRGQCVGACSHGQMECLGARRYRL